ncbi:MAG: hypothetical protein AAGH15_20430 [Myxococcota bacterium]
MERNGRLLTLPLLLALACTADTVVVRGTADAGPDGSISLDGGAPDGSTPDGASPDAGSPGLPATTELDLLFVIDNSNSMEQEQASLVNEVPRLVRAFAEGRITDPATGAVVSTFTPATSIHVGVINTDMGAGGNVVPTCTNSSFGDDGLLLTEGNVMSGARSCEASYPSFQVFDGSAPDLLDETARVANDVACMAEVGTDGCGFEQQLDAALKSITPASSPLTFQEGTRGNGDTNAGFLRPGATLAIVMVTDEDDCSVLEPDLYNPSSTRFSGDLNLRCFNHPEAVHPVSRFIDGLVAGRDARRLVFAPIVGVPVRLAPAAGVAPDYAGILADPDMIERVDATSPNRLETSCNVPGRGLAFPPRRIVQTAEGLDGRGAYVTVQSICQSDFGPALDAVVARVVESMAAQP